MDRSEQGSEPKGFISQCRQLNEHLEKAHAIVNEIIPPISPEVVKNIKELVETTGNINELDRELMCALMSVGKLVARLNTILQRF